MTYCILHNKEEIVTFISMYVHGMSGNNDKNRYASCPQGERSTEPLPIHKLLNFLLLEASVQNVLDKVCCNTTFSQVNIFHPTNHLTHILLLLPNFSAAAA